MTATDSGLDVFATLSVSLGRLSEQMDRQAADERRKMETARARAASIVRLNASAVCPTPSVNFSLNFDGPQAGFEWVVRRIITGGLTWTTTALGTAEVYVSALAGAGAGSSSSGVGTVAGIRSLADLVDQSTALPNKAFYGREELVVKEGESLAVVIVGGTAGQQYVATCSIQQVRTPSLVWGASQGI